MSRFALPRLLRARPRRPWRTLAALVLLAAESSAGLAAAPTYPPVFAPILEQALDDPQAAQGRAEREAADGDVQTRFWRQLALAGVTTMLERTEATRAAVARARELLAELPGATLRHHLWLEAYAIGADFRVVSSPTLLQRSVALHQRALGLGDEHLLCEIAAGDLFLLRDTRALDEAWMAAEETERCGARLGMPHLETSALIALGTLAGALSDKAPTESYFERALAALGTRPARFQRAWIEWELGNTLARQQRREPAAAHYETAIALSREIGDAIGAAIVLLDLAELRLAQGEPERALALARDAEPGLRSEPSPARAAAAAGVIVDALARLKRPEVAKAIERARALEPEVLSEPARARLARRIAAGHASLGQHARAYEELLRSLGSLDRGERVARDAQVLRLQARYELARREAEMADLRHRAEAARLALEAREAQQRALWAAVAALVALLAAALWLGLHALARRRHLADLAMRDELTAMPNRRAVLAYGQDQFRLCRRLGLDLSIALVDLDHFKQVNDRHGHAAGDHALRAFARVSREVLRGQDRMGRYGGDEWLLVMPGAGMHELGPIFERLRAGLAAHVVDGMPVPHGLTLSMGGASMRPEVDSLETLIGEADRHLYRAKAEGRDRLRHPQGETAPAAGAALLAGTTA